LVTQLAEKAGLRIHGAERIGHDLWASGNLSELTFAEQLTLLLIGFDLTFRVNPREQQVEIVPSALPVKLSRRYQVPAALSVSVLEQQFPDLAFQGDGGEVLVEGLVESHERLAAALRGERPIAREQVREVQSNKRYTLRVEEQPVHSVLQELSRRLGWKIVFDGKAEDATSGRLEQRVTFAVQGADEDQLLTAILRPVGLAHEREGHVIRVFVAR
jgi:hypothetical protein